MVPGDGRSEPLNLRFAFRMILASAGRPGLTACAALDPEGTQPPLTMPDAANALGVTADFDQEERKWATLIKLNLTGD